MELKDAAVALAGIAVVLLALGFFTGGVAFYAASGLALAVLAIDLARYLWLVRDLKRNLTDLAVRLGHGAAPRLDGHRLLRPGIPGPAKGPRASASSRPTGRCPSTARPLSSISRRAARPSRSPSGRHRRGSHAVKSLRMTVESFLFRGTMTAGGDAAINAYLAMGQDRAGTGSRRGRLQRLQLPGSEALRRGTGSDFSYVRDFMPGDSTRNIDWARSSRSPTLVVRAFEDEHTLPLFILIDVDPSMDRGTAKTELESAVELATLLASRVLLDNERVGLASFSRSDITSYLSPAGGKDQMSYIRTALSSLKAVEGDTAARSGFPTLQEAEAVRRMFGRRRGTGHRPGHGGDDPAVLGQRAGGRVRQGHGAGIPVDWHAVQHRRHHEPVHGRGQPAQRQPHRHVLRPQRGRRADAPHLVRQRG